MTTLLVAAAGGHLRCLYELRPRLTGTGDVAWVTFDSPQSRSLLADEEEVHFAAYPQPKAIGTNLRNAAMARRLLRSGRFERVVSTGSSIAVSFLPLAALRSLPSHYIESATRVRGPSLTGRILARVPRVRLYSQYPALAHDPWSYRGSLFDGFEAEVLGPRPIRRVLVTVGTAQGFGFRSLIERALAVVPEGAEVTWQTGPNDVSDLAIEPRPDIPADEFDRLLGEVDVVISHAGAGSSLAAFRAGAFPVLVPRRRARGEHTDEHQAELAEELAERGLARWTEVGDLSAEDLSFAAARRVRREGELPPFELIE